ncbi:MAG: insulinase family protein [Muribaculaceae bacterium]|nr:insulinase family protein [Muribaculaceae bacterium]
MTNRSIAPEIFPIEDVTIPQPERITLRNGAHMLVIRGGEGIVCQFTIFITGGVFEQTKPLQARLTAMMLQRGSQAFAAQELAEALDQQGAFCSATVHDHHTEVRLTCLCANLRHVLSIVTDFIAHPTFPESELATLKTQMAAAYAQMRQQPRYHAQIALQQNLYGENHPLVGRIDDSDIENLCSDDLARFHSSFYYPQNCVISLAGNVGEREKNIVDEVFGAWQRPGTPQPPTPWHRQLSPTLRGMAQIDGAVQSSVQIAIDSVPRPHPDYIKLRIATTALGGYFGSRLMSNIREEKGYTYGISAMLLGRQDESHVLIASECDTEYTQPLIQEVIAEVERMSSVPLSDDELWAVKQELMSDALKIVDNPFSIASYLKSTILYGVENDYFAKQVEEVKNISAQAIIDISRQYLRSENLRIFVAGNVKNLQF